MFRSHEAAQKMGLVVQIRPPAPGERAVSSSAEALSHPASQLYRDNLSLSLDVCLYTVSKGAPALVRRVRCSDNASNQSRRHFATALGLGAWAKLLVQDQRADAYGGSKSNPKKAPKG